MAELPAWGRDQGKDAHVVAAKSADATRIRELAIWQMLEAEGRAPDLQLSGIGHFRTPNNAKPHAILTRLLTLLRELETDVLPQLGRVVRCRAHVHHRTMRQPSGGRILPLASARRSPLGPHLTQQWMVARVERMADSPVNRFASAVLRYAERWMQHLQRLYLQRGRVAPPQLREAHAALTRFWRHSPLDTIALERHDTPHRLFPPARRRRAELHRMGHLVQWWTKLNKVELTAIDVAIHNARINTVGVHTTYELMHAMALVCALARPGSDPRVASESMEFQTPSGPITLSFHDRSYAPARAPTATLRRKQHTLYIQARNLAQAAITPLLAELALWTMPSDDRAAIVVTPRSMDPSPYDSPRVEVLCGPSLKPGPPDLADWWRRQLQERGW